MPVMRTCRGNAFSPFEIVLRGRCKYKALWLTLQFASWVVYVLCFQLLYMAVGMAFVGPLREGDMKRWLNYQVFTSSFQVDIRWTAWGLGFFTFPHFKILDIRWTAWGLGFFTCPHFKILDALDGIWIEFMQGCIFFHICNRPSPSSKQRCRDFKQSQVTPSVTLPRSRPSPPQNFSGMSRLLGAQTTFQIKHIKAKLLTICYGTNIIFIGAQENAYLCTVDQPSNLIHL